MTAHDWRRRISRACRWRLIHRLVLCAFSASLLSCWAANGRADDRQLAEELTQKLYEGRMRLQLAELEWTVELLEHSKVPFLVGCTYKYHAWYDYLEDRYRVDLDQNCPLNAELTQKSRFAYSGRRYLIVNSEKLVGHEIEGRGREFMHDESSFSVFMLSADPRLLGVFPTSLTTLKNYTPDDILQVFQTSQDYEVSEEVIDGHTMTRLRFIGYMGVDCTITYWLDDRVGNMPVRIVSETARGVNNPLRGEFQTKWKSFEDRSDPTSIIWMPVESVARRWIDDELKTHERFLLHDAVIGERPDNELFTWKAMNLPDRFVVMHKSGKEKEMKRWAAATQTFGEWEPKLLNPPGPPGEAPPTNTGGRMLFVLGNLAVGIVLLAYLFIRRRANKEA